MSLQTLFSKKLLAIYALLLCTTVAVAQQYNNEWIDYSKTYYKFKIGRNGLYRISQATLQANGLGGVAVQGFQLWRNGQQVPIFTSIATGTLGTSDYLEFYGVMNDGKPDKALYPVATYQINDRVSLQTDSATYFLTYSTTQNGLRFAGAANNIAGNTLPAEPYLTYTEKTDFKDFVNRGYADTSPGEYIFSSSYDDGEALSTLEVNPTGTIVAFSYPKIFYPYLANGSCTVTVGAIGTAPNNRNAEFYAGNSLLGSISLSTFEKKVQSFSNVPISSFPNATAFLYGTKNLCPNINDRIVVSFIDVTYARLFKFNNQTSFEFELPANTTGKYLEITDFNRGSSLPVLYDLTNNRRYVAEVNAAGVIRLALPASSTTTSYVLVSEDAGAVSNITTGIQQRNFVNYSVVANQGNYLIISNNLLYAPINGSSPVEQYRVYRSSAAGGGYNAKVFDIDQLEDQFAFGIKKHPLSVKNFLRFARQSFSAAPRFAFLIGKGVSYQYYRLEQTNSYADRLNLIPTFGFPGSDVMLSSNDNIPYPATPIGRLSVVNGQEILDYLNKVKTHDAFLINPSQSQTDKLWTKNIVHVVGANDPGLGSTLGYYMDGYKSIIQDTLFGGNVTTLNKFSTGTATSIDNQLVGSLFENGISLLTYFGHSSATALDYNLEDPNNYNNPNKYPLFLLNGCNAGNFFEMDTARFTVKSTISEKYVLAPNRGSIGMIASTWFGITTYLNSYSTGFYRSVGRQGYGMSIGKNAQDASQFCINDNLSSSYGLFNGYNHAAQQTLHGDPAIQINNYAKPDYSIEAPNIYINPSLISVAENSFKVKVYHYNLGRAIGDSITVQVKRQYPASIIYPNGFTELVYSRKGKATLYVDSLELTLPIISNRDKGTNRITVSVETENRIDELSESNNTASRDVTIFEDEMRPIYPYNFAIVNRQGIKLLASTSSPITSAAHAYRMELDTTELFNSALKVTRNVNTSGGIVEFDPGVSFTDSTVYYWRLAPVPANGTPTQWNSFSFIYLANSATTGYNQSHVYQHLKSGVERIYIDSTSRRWQFATRNNNLFITQSVYPVSGTEDQDFSVSVNNSNIIQSACLGGSIIINVFDPITFKPWVNDQRFGAAPICGPSRTYNFEWQNTDTAKRNSIVRFMDAIPNGYYVVVRKFLNDIVANETYAATWKNDEQYYGAGNSLYHRLKATGFVDIDSFNRPRTFSMVYKKGDPSFTKWKFSDGLERTQLNVYCPTPDTLGYVTSPVFGPARAWKQVKWRGASVDNQPGDYATVSVVGVNSVGAETLLYNLSPSQQDFDISSVDVNQYPYLRLRLRNADSINGTAYNLRYWRLLYDPIPEGALASNILFRSKDTMDLGDSINFAIAFKNISDVKFQDSIKVKAIILDQNNVPHVLPVSRKRDLQPGDTTTISIKLDNRNYVGRNNLYLEVNPVDSAQPEQYHFNNFIYRDFFVNSDKYNPLLDVTFDGVHILNKDIVSSKPHIQIKLKDESKFLLLNDTSLMKLTLRYPDNTLRTYRFGTDTLRFTPAASGADNTATIDFYPTLDQDMDANTNNTFYDLTISGKDRLNNQAGPSDFNVSFQVFNKPMISNLFNYPNPFTTSTAFVFTITGNEIPQEFKIQILTITGKIVREVTKAELGPLTIGRNITEFKWDGTDQFGGKLANGVYLYRVVTGLNGKKLDHFRLNDGYDQNAQDETDKFFNKGYGKMYLMR